MARGDGLDRTLDLSPEEARDALARVSDQLRALAKSERASRYAIGVKLRHCDALELWRAEGHASLVAYAAVVLEVPDDWIWTTLRVVDAYRESTVISFGFERLDRMLRYIASTPEDETADDMPDLTIRVPAADGEGTVEKLFEEASVAEIERAVDSTREIVLDDRRARPEVRRAVLRAERALDAAVQDVEREAAIVGARRGPAGDVLVDVEGVPWEVASDALAAVAEALRGARRAPAKKKPAARTKPPAAKTKKPATKKQKPATKKQKPATKKQKPATKKQKPATKTKRPRR